MKIAPIVKYNYIDPFVNAEESIVKIVPLEDRVIVRPDKAEERIGNIILPDIAKEKPQRGTVLAVGLGRKDDKGERIPVGVKEGEKVLYGSFAGVEVQQDGQTLLIIRECDILGRLV